VIRCYREALNHFSALMIKFAFRPEKRSFLLRYLLLFRGFVSALSNILWLNYRKSFHLPVTRDNFFSWNICGKLFQWTIFRLDQFFVNQIFFNWLFRSLEWNDVLITLWQVTFKLLRDAIFYLHKMTERLRYVWRC
jgi:hypothetical protein